MFARFLLLTSVLLSALVNAAEYNMPGVSNEDIYGEPVLFSYSGYTYYQWFSDNNMQDNRAAVAVNLDASYYNFAIRTQLGQTNGYEKNGFRRYVLEYAHPILESTEMIYQYGRFGRVDSFFSGILDAPANYQMAILPFAGYSYRMFNGSFVMMDGHNLQFKHKLTTGLIGLRYATGKMVIDDQNGLQKEAFKRTIDGITMEPKSGVYDVALTYETENWNFYVSRNTYETEQKTNSTSRTLRTMVSYYNKIEYDLVRAGAQYHTNEWFYRYELANGDTATSSVVGNTVSESKSKDFNNVAGIHISDNTTLYAGFSKGTNLTKKYSNYDRFVGATYNYKDWTFSVEYHNGEANKKSWVKYDSPEVNSTWNMVVIGTTYRF